MTKILILIMALILGCSSTPDSPHDGPIPRILIIGLDGVSYQTIQKMQAGGYFREFNPVSPMVSTFPSVSDPNWTRIMGLPPEYCYTKACFDPNIKTKTGMGRENGSLLTHLSRHPLYERTVDFRAEGIWEHLTMFIWTETTGKYWAEALEEKLFEFRGKKKFFSLFINPDLIAHTEGEGKLMEYLAFLDKRIGILRSRYEEKFGNELDVVLVSDHGNYFNDPVDIALESGLESQGWKLADTISGPKDVGFYVPEILSFGAFFCQKGREEKLARSISQISNIHITAYLNRDGTVRIFGNRGRSETQVSLSKDKQVVYYNVIQGTDPLDQIQYFSSGKMDVEDYFRKTLSSNYPNAVVRIWEAFFENSQVKPSVVANPQLGYVFGNKALRLITNIKGLTSSHGGLHREESLGIFMSTDDSTKPIRSQDFIEAVDD